MTKKEIQGHQEELYQTEISTELISTVDKTYPVLFLDCIHVKAREGNTVINKAVYLAIAINKEDRKELLGL